MERIEAERDGVLSAIARVKETLESVTEDMCLPDGGTSGGGSSTLSSGDALSTGSGSSSSGDGGRLFLDKELRDTRLALEKLREAYTHVSHEVL